MERFICWLIAIFLLSSCAATKSSVKVDEHKIVDIDSSKVVNQANRIFVDTTKITTSKIKITKIEFFDPDRNRKEYKSPAIDPDESKDDGDESDDDHPSIKNLPVKSIEITEIENGVNESGVTKEESSAMDSTKIVKNVIEEKKTQERTKPVDPYKFRWITIALILVIAFYIAIWLQFRKK